MPVRLAVARSTLSCSGHSWMPWSRAALRSVTKRPNHCKPVEELLWHCSQGTYAQLRGSCQACHAFALLGMCLSRATASFIYTFCALVLLGRNLCLVSNHCRFRHSIMAGPRSHLPKILTSSDVPGVKRRLDAAACTSAGRQDPAAAGLLSHVPEDPLPR